MNEPTIKYGVFRLDIYTPPGWLLLTTYDTKQDADFCCDMLNQDTGYKHLVFEVEDYGRPVL